MKTMYPLLMVSGTIACLAIVIANPYYAIYPLAAIGIGMHILSKEMTDECTSVRPQ